MTRHIAPALLSAFRLAARTILFSALGVAVPTLASGPDELTRMLSGKVVLVGETHGSAGSLELTSKLVTEAFRRHACVTLALEIGHGQQLALDAAMRGQGSMQDVGLYPAIGHPAYRSWLSGLPRSAAANPCFRVLAADLPTTQAGDRDRTIAAQIAQEVAAGRFVVGLFGALHVSRGVAYRYSRHRSAADYLARRGIAIVSVLESEPPICGPGGLRQPGSTEALPAIENLRQTVNGLYPANPARIVDAVWLGASTGCSISAATSPGQLD